MAIVDGGKRFGTWMPGDANQPLCIPYAKAAADTVLIKGGHPVAITTTTFTGTSSNGSAVVTAVSSLVGLAVGQTVTGSNIAAGSTIISIDSATQITLSANATGTNSGLTAYGGTTVARAAVTSSYVTNTRLLGFAASDDLATTTADYGGFGIAIPPALTYQNKSLQQVQVFVSDGVTRFIYAVVSGVTVTNALVGSRVGFKLEDATGLQFAVDPAATNKVAYITDIVPSDVNLAGGRVVIDLISTVRQYPTPY
jgi:hypothetical protein